MLVVIIFGGINRKKFDGTHSFDVILNNILVLKTAINFNFMSTVSAIIWYIVRQRV